MTAALEARVAELEAELAVLRDLPPIRAALAPVRRLAAIAANRARAEALIAMPAEQRATALAALTDPEARDMFAGEVDVVRLLAGIDLTDPSWAVVARFAPRQAAMARIAHSPAVERVSISMPRGWTRLEPHAVDDRTARKLEALGLDVIKARSGSFVVRLTVDEEPSGVGGRSRSRTVVLTAAAWAALLEAHPGVAESLAAGDLSVERLPDEASRSLSLGELLRGGPL